MVLRSVKRLSIQADVGAVWLCTTETLLAADFFFFFRMIIMKRFKKDGGFPLIDYVCLIHRLGRSYDMMVSVPTPLNI